MAERTEKELLIVLINYIDKKFERWPNREFFICVDLEAMFRNEFLVSKEEYEKLKKYLKKNRPTKNLHPEFYIEYTDLFIGRDSWFEYGDNESRREFLNYLLHCEVLHEKIQEVQSQQ